MTPQRPSRAWYALVAIPGLATILIFAWAIPQVIDSFTRLGSHHVVEMPGERELQLRAGSTEIWAEGDARDVQLACEVQATADGRAVKVAPYGTTTSTYQAGTFAGVAVFELEVPADGAYRVRCTAEPPMRIAIGRSFAVLPIVIAALALFAMLPLTGIIGWAVHRARHKKPRAA